MRWLASWLFGVQPIDPITFGGVAVVLILVTLLASMIPVHRAITIEPATIVRGN